MEVRPLEVRPLIGALGGEISGVDLALPLDARTVEQIRSALWEYQVLVFRDQKLTCDQHKDFARHFGPLNVHPFIYARPLEGHPEIVRVVKEKDDTKIFGEKWHADVTFLERPVLGSALYAIDTPERGGDTLFANMYRAYDTLSTGMKELLEKLVAVHEAEVPEIDPLTQEPVKPMKLGLKRGEHPVIKVHPETGKKLLYVNCTYTRRFKGMTDEESQPLLEYLFRHATKAEFTTRVRWAPGTLTFWDNRSTQHLPVDDYFGFRREMHRVTVET